MKYFRSTRYPIEVVLSEHINKNFSSHNHAQHYIISLCDRLINHFSDSLPLESLARDLYVSKYYLIRKCKRNLGLTPHKFHLQNRIRKAQTLLFTNKSVTEASMNTFEPFNNGKLVTPAATKDSSNIPWREHPNFTDAELAQRRIPLPSGTNHSELQHRGRHS